MSTTPSRTKQASKPKTTSPRRKKPGSKGSGKYFHIEVQASGDFVTFRTQDVGDPGHIQRVAGKREDGTWETVKWLVSKDDAHLERGRLVADTEDAKKLFEDLKAKPRRTEGDRFEVKPSTRKRS